jgi:hypothetical protein
MLVNKADKILVGDYVFLSHSFSDQELETHNRLAFRFCFHTF